LYVSISTSLYVLELTTIAIVSEYRSSVECADRQIQELKETASTAVVTDPTVVEGLRADKDRLVVKLDALRKSSSQASADLHREKQILEVALASLQSLSEECETELQTAHTEIQLELDQLRQSSRESNGRLMDRLEAFRAELEQLSQAHQSVVDGLTRDHTAATNLVKELRALNADASTRHKNSIAELHYLVEELTTTNRDLQQRLTDVEQEKVAVDALHWLQVCDLGLEVRSGKFIVDAAAVKVTDLEGKLQDVKV
jgi:DNA repair exonuclease SbcCD ATPase subunit